MWTIGGKKANIVFPLLPSPRRMLRGGGRRESRAQTAHRHQIFKENLPGIALLPENARDHVVTIATQRLPARGLPCCGHCPQGSRTSIGALCTLIMSRRSSVGTALACWTHRSIPAPSPTWFGNGPKPTTARARGNRTDHPEHTSTIM